jgi:hypothetical protein
MHVAMNDQLFLPLSFCAFDCCWQSAHFSFCLAHFALAAFHCLVVHLETFSIAVDVVDGVEGVAVGAVGAVGAVVCACAACAVTKQIMRTVAIVFSIVSSLSKCHPGGPTRIAGRVRVVFFRP